MIKDIKQLEKDLPRMKKYNMKSQKDYNLIHSENVVYKEQLY